MLYILRHGETEWNFINRTQGRVDIPLNECGREQSRNAAIKIARVNFSKIYSSPLSRALETCCLAASVSQNEIIIDDRLVERDFGKLEGQEFTIKQSNEIGLWNLDDQAVLKIQGLESLKQMKKRVYSFLKDILEECATHDVLVSTHFGVVCLMSMFFEGRPKSKNISEYKIDNADIRVFEVKIDKKSTD